ncbi:MAG: hypothetical protein D6725_09065 [Planctomycetota bacterium]|nr:MAG: hypothetical protein D6725_09065 [Planctomycetota bacterium]
MRLATTTSTRDSGLLDVVLPVFERETGIRCDVIAVGTGKALELGRRGDVDVVLVHARKAEERFMQEGHGVRREDVMWNRFVVVGPADDPATIRGLGVLAALQRIAEKRAAFVSRGDDSGTHKRERALWAELGIEPDWADYVETGLGQGRTLMVADQLRAYCLTDEATFLNMRNKLQLVPLVTDDPRLRNEYGVIVVSPGKHPGVRAELAARFVDFLISPAGQALIAGFRIEGRQVFRPAHGFEQPRAGSGASLATPADRGRD